MKIEVCQVFVSVDLDSVLRLRPHLLHYKKSNCFGLCYLCVSIGNEISVKITFNCEALFWIPQNHNIFCYFHGNDHFMF